jgi:hypothetical protein
VNGDEEIPCNDFDYDCDPDIAVAFRGQLFTLAAIPEESRNTVNYKDYPAVPSFAFLLYSLSRPALRLVRRFLPLLAIILYIATFIISSANTKLI